MGKQPREKRVPRDTRALDVFGLGSTGLKTMRYLVEEASPLGLGPYFANAVGFDSHVPTIAEVTNALHPFMREPSLLKVRWRSYCNMRVVQLPGSPYGSPFGCGRNQEAFAEAQPFWLPTVQEEIERAKAHVMRLGYKLAVTITTGSHGGAHRDRLEDVIRNILADSGFITNITLSITNIPSRSDKLASENFQRALPEIPSRNDVTVVLDDNPVVNYTHDRLAARVIDGMISANLAEGSQPAITDLVNIFRHDDTKIIGLNVIENPNPTWRRRWTWARRLDPDDGASVIFSQLKTVLSNNSLIAKTSPFNPKEDDSTQVVLCVTPYSNTTFLRVFRAAQETLDLPRVLPLWVPSGDMNTTTALLFKVPIEELTQSNVVSKTMVPYV